MENAVLKAIEQRRSIRAYKDRHVTSLQLEALKNAALQSPSANNLQPLHFSFVQNQQLLKKADEIYEELMEGKISFPRSVGAKNLYYDAPLVVVISADKNAKRRTLDAGIAVATLALAAESMGLSSVIIGMLDIVFMQQAALELKEKMCFPKDYEFQVAIAIGYADTTKNAHDMRPQNISVIE